MGRARFEGLLFFLLTLLAWGPFLPIGEFEGTEARRAVIARNMVESGDYVLPRLGGEATLTKPPLHYQLGALSMLVFGKNRFAARLPSLLLFALFFALLSRFLAQQGWPGKDRWFCFALFLTHPLLFKFGTSAEMDGGFAALTGSALLLLASLLRAPGRSWGVFFGAGLVGGLAVAIKGPMAPILFAGPLWFLLRSKRWVGIGAWGLGLLLPSALWLALLFSHGLDWGQLLTIWERETVGRNSGFPLWHFFKSAPLFLLSVCAMGLPPLLLFLGGWRRPKEPPEPGLRALGFSFALGVLALLFTPHRPTRYVLPALLPGLLVLYDLWRRGAFPPGKHDPAFFLRRVLGGLGLVAGVVLLFQHPSWMRVLPWALLLLPLAALLRGPRPIVLALGVCGVLFLGVDRKAWNAVPKRSPVGGLRHLAGIVGKQPVFAWGHVPPYLLWKLGPQIRQSEFFQSPYRGEPWILWEEGVPGEHPFPAKTQEWERFRVGRKTLVLSKRTPK